MNYKMKLLHIGTVVNKEKGFELYNETAGNKIQVELN